MKMTIEFKWLSIRSHWRILDNKINEYSCSSKSMDFLRN